MKQLLLEISPVFSPTLDNFVAGRNAELVQTLRTCWQAAGANAPFTSGVRPAAEKRISCTAWLRPLRKRGGLPCW